MSETVNIATISEKLSGQLFKVFGWEQHGPTNFNFRESPSDEVKRRTKHPCDVVFRYSNPYRDFNTYLLTDLKSYSKASIDQKSKIKSTITSLGKSLRAANNSSEFWGHLPGDGGRLSALLFIYNHDNQYDGDFQSVLIAHSPSPLDIPTNASLYVFGPDQIQFLLNVYNDLEKVFGTEKLNQQPFRFFYPNLIEKLPLRNEWECATPELLLSPYIPVIFDKPQGDGKNSKHIHLYYRGSGETYEEFCFIFDFLFRFNVIDDFSLIKIKIAERHSNSAATFKRAKNEFSSHFYKQDAAFEKLDQISLDSMPVAVYEFHEIEIGMERRKEFANAE